MIRHGFDDFMVLVVMIMIMIMIMILQSLSFEESLTAFTRSAVLEPTLHR